MIGLIKINHGKNQHFYIILEFGYAFRDNESIFVIRILNTILAEFTKNLKVNKKEENTKKTNADKLTKLSHLKFILEH